MKISGFTTGYAMLVCYCLALYSLPATAVQVMDDAGHQVSLVQPARRIISLAPHITELLFAAGAGDAVVGTVSFSDYPAEAGRLPGVGDYANLDIETIVALQPDLVVAWQSGNSRPQVEQLERLGLPVFYSEPRRLEDIAGNLERLGRLAGRETVAEAAATRFRARYRRLGTRYAQAATIRVFYEIWQQPLMTVGGEHLISQVIRLCGGENVFSGLDTLAPTVNREAVLAADPEVIIVAGPASQRSQWLDAWRKWPRLAAVRQDQLYFIPPDLIQRQTPRVLDGAERMCEQLEQARHARQPLNR